MLPLLPWKINVSIECVFVVLATQHATGMRHIIICSVSGAKYFSTSSHKRTIFEKKVPEHKKCVLNLFTSYVQNTSHSKKN